MKIPILFMLFNLTLGSAIAAEPPTELRGFNCENHMYRKSIVNLDGSNLSFEDSWLWYHTDELKKQIKSKVGRAEIITISDIGISMKTDHLACDRSQLESFRCDLSAPNTLARLSLQVWSVEKKFGQEHFITSKLVIPVKIQDLELAMKKSDRELTEEAQFLADVSLQLEENSQPVHLKWETFFHTRNITNPRNAFSFCRTW